jgi:hypothetical protein
MTLDDIRSRRWGFAVYALDPSDPVTLEVHTNGETYTWEGATVAACLEAAFGPVVSQTPPSPALLVGSEQPTDPGPPLGQVGGVAETTDASVFD